MLLAALPLLAVGSGATASNSAPPRNGLIAVAGGEGITIVDPRTGAERVLPKTDLLGEPAWSPDATLLAVTSWADDMDSVYTMKSDGTDRRLVLDNASSASWSPDGKQLVVVRATKISTSLAIVDADGTDAHMLVGTAEASSPKWSPDGKRIAFLDRNGVVSTIAPQGDVAPMPTKIEASGFSWSPDSSKLAYDGYRGEDGAGHAVVVVVDLASGRETTLTGAQTDAETPSWSPEGDQIAFLSMSSTSASSGCGSHVDRELWVMNADGSKAHNAAPGIAAYSAASWAQAISAAPALTSIPTKVSPTSKTAVTPTLTSRPAMATKPAVAPKPEPAVTPKPTPTPGTAARPAPSSEPLQGANGLVAVRGEGGLFLVDPNTAESRAIPGTAAMWAPAWAPDMKELAVEQAEKNGSSSIYTIRPDGTHARLVLENASAPSWSASGDRIFAVRSECAGPCASDEDADKVLYAVNADGTGAKRVDFDDADAYTSRELAWPVDGSAIHFFDEASLSGPGTFDSDAATWSPDETMLAFTGALHAAEDETADNGLWIVSAEGGSPTLLLSGAVGRPTWAR